eukprot:GHVT01084617.1.p2 GENE.GHVT01084617.1~~GHVT01084617.1.p2  ORF type:complete len:122 (+),score=29.68 GHVT01084617.1:1120-1485(+)
MPGRNHQLSLSFFFLAKTKDPTSVIFLSTSLWASSQLLLLLLLVVFQEPFPDVHTPVSATGDEESAAQILHQFDVGVVGLEVREACGTRCNARGLTATAGVGHRRLVRNADAAHTLETHSE